MDPPSQPGLFEHSEVPSNSDNAFSSEPPVPPSHSPQTQTRLENASAAPFQQTPPTPTNPTPRLAIHSLRLENFKSYGELVHVGPFHKNFSAIVGPNGSGKSNVIDAMLFVFGRPAKHLRHSKLAELIHNSATVPNVLSATVTVFFHDIIDTGDGDNDFTVLPNSQFSVARTAYRNNTSKYFLDNKEVKRKDVVDLLKSKGVDLDNNRFLILQGEVEQIALMKPKSTTAHDTGLLEYLEDIIGSNRHIEQIEKTAATVEALNEQRNHKLNRVKAAERERDTLEAAKLEAEDYVDKERDMLNKKITLCKARQSDARRKHSDHKGQHEEAKQKVADFRTQVSEKETAVVDLEAKFKDTQKHENNAVAKLNQAREEYAAFERKDIKLREDMKAFKAKDKKLRAILQREGERSQENCQKADEFDKEKQKADDEMPTAEADVTKAQKKFDEVRDHVKKNTQPIRERLERKQAELLPFSESVNNARKELQVNQSTLNLLRERLAAPQKNLDDASEALKSLKPQLENATTRLRKLEADKNARQAAIRDADAEIQTRRANLERLSQAYSTKRRRVEEARSAREFSNTRSKLHKAILSASRSGRLRGVVGRLGDLATVDERYATAVSAAAGASLDNIVVRSAGNAQECIQFLRSENLGRATFIILEKVDYLRRGMSSWSQSERGRDGKRLFDMLEIPNEANHTALYYALHDTLVASSLEEARRMAFKPTRQNRVVTLSGELIESTGAMTGGGRGPTKYKLGSGRASDGEMDAEQFKSICAEMERQKAEMDSEKTDIEECEQERRSASEDVENLEIQESKCRVEVSSLQSRVKTMEKDTIPALKKAVDNVKDASGSEDMRKCKAAEKAVVECERALDRAKASCEGLESDIAGLQEEILKAGGTRLEKVKNKLEEYRQALSALQSQASTAVSRAAAARKTSAKAEAAAESARSEREQVLKDLEEAREHSENMLNDAQSVADKIKSAEEVHSEWAEKLQEIQSEYSDVKGSLKSLRRKEVSLVDSTEALRQLVEQDIHVLRAFSKEEKLLQSKLKKLAMMDIPTSRNADNTDSVDDSAIDTIEKTQESDADNEDREDEMEIEEGAQNGGEGEETVGTEVLEMSHQERRKLEAEIASLESELATMNPNLGAITEYATKDREYRAQVGDLDEVTKQRDDSRRECDSLRKARLDEFMSGFSVITLKLKELYQMITLGGDAELELVDSLDPFSEGIVFSVRPPKKSWKNICNLSGGEKTLSSLALVFALHHFKPTPLYFLDEIDAALDYKNVSIVGNYVKERTKNAQFIIISLRNNMFELADRLVGIYKTHHTTKSVTINPHAFVMPAVESVRMTQGTDASSRVESNAAV